MYWQHNVIYIGEDVLATKSYFGFVLAIYIWSWVRTTRGVRAYSFTFG